MGEGRKLYLIGMPLNDEETLSERANSALQRCTVVIGESRPLTLKRLKEAATQPAHVYFLDHLSPPDEKALITLLRELPAAANVGLFSDTGLPVLFDPGEAIVTLCREAQYEIHTIPGPASWSVACAASGWSPPFLLAGFPPQKREERLPFFRSLQRSAAQVVLMETPYRFRALLEQLGETLGKRAEIFLAWELGAPSEHLFWGTLEACAQYCERNGLQKGEFVVILKGVTATRRS